jgi:hypothetical protein
MKSPHSHLVIGKQIDVLNKKFAEQEAKLKVAIDSLNKINKSGIYQTNLVAYNALNQIGDE